MVDAMRKIKCKLGEGRETTTPIKPYRFYHIQDTVSKALLSKPLV
jgi:hypothetical protein